MMAATAIAALATCGASDCENTVSDGSVYCSRACGRRAKKHRQATARRMVREFEKRMSPCLVLRDLAPDHAQKKGLTVDQSLALLEEKAAADVERGIYLGCWHEGRLLAVGKPKHLTLGESARRIGRRAGTGAGS